MSCQSEKIIFNLAILIRLTASCKVTICLIKIFTFKGDFPSSEEGISAQKKSDLWDTVRLELPQRLVDDVTVLDL